MNVDLVELWVFAQLLTLFVVLIGSPLAFVLFVLPAMFISNVRGMLQKRSQEHTGERHE